MSKRKAMATSKRVWIAWERQRRSVELSSYFNCESYFITSWNSSRFRYFLCAIATIKILLKSKPKVLFVQNPSIILTLLCCLLKPIFDYKLVVDRHTNFKFQFRHSKSPKWMLFKCISKYTILSADFTIVTNKYLKLYVKKIGGNAFILPDKLPELKAQKISELSKIGRPTALVICSFQSDEPYEEVIQAAKTLREVEFLFTGKYENVISKEKMGSLQENIKLLGFVSEQNYIDLLFSVDFTIILTKHEFILNCGSYESMVAQKPMLLSNTRTIKMYFRKGAVHCENFTPERIVDAITELIGSLEIKKRELIAFKPILEKQWSDYVYEIESELGIDRV